MLRSRPCLLVRQHCVVRLPSWLARHQNPTKFSSALHHHATSPAPLHQRPACVFFCASRSGPHCVRVSVLERCSFFFFPAAPGLRLPFEDPATGPLPASHHDLASPRRSIHLDLALLLFRVSATRPRFACPFQSLDAQTASSNCGPICNTSLCRPHPGSGLALHDTKRPPLSEQDIIPSTTLDGHPGCATANPHSICDTTSLCMIGIL